MKSITIAIDGPAGAGKSTVAKMLAQRLNLCYLDTGAMYRALALAATRIGIGKDDEDLAIALCSRIEISFDQHGNVTLDGENVSQGIRTAQIAQLASDLSRFAGVRTQLVARQQEIISNGGYILEGRDTTTVVAPNATLKVFLTASLEERARRRAKDFAQIGTESSYGEIVKQIAERDHQDYTRDESPLKIADDAIPIESFGVSPEAICDQIESVLRARGTI